jgi:hypothetical protein
MNKPMDKMVFAILTLLFHAYGVNCFLQGDTKTGIIRIVLSLVTCGLCGTIFGIMGIILAIKVFQMSDEEYQAAYGTIDMGFPAMATAKAE